jgi:hypothetical protein
MNKFRNYIRKKMAAHKVVVEDARMEESWERLASSLQRKEKSAFFDGYEPELNDAYIEQKWNEIRFFLPEENQRRLMPLLLKPGCTVPVAILFLVAAFYFVVHTDPGTGDLPAYAENHQRKVVNTDPLKAPAGSIAVHDRATLQAGQSNKIALRQPIPKQYTKKDKRAVTVTEQGTMPDEPGSFRTEEMPAQTDVSVMSLLPAELSGFVSGPDLKKMQPPDSVPHRLKKELFYDLTGGYIHSYGSFDPEVMKKSLHTNGLCLGIALHYKVSRRLMISAQGMWSRIQKEYELPQSKNLVVSRAPATGPVMGSHDSIISYIPYAANGSWRLHTNYQAGAGIEYKLFQRKRFSASVSVVLRVSGSSLSYSNSNQRLYDDTLSYLKTSSSPALAHSVNSLPTEENNSRSKRIGAGSFTGLNVSYGITDRISLLLRTGNYYEWLAFPSDRPFIKKQHSFFIAAGLRMNFHCGKRNQGNK